MNHRHAAIALIVGLPAACGTLPACAASPTEPPAPAQTGVVERVIDGDTIVVRSGGRLETVRYIGIDAPETVHPTRGVEPFGPEASDFNRRLVSGKRLLLEFDVERRDRYGRLLAYVYVGALFVNAELVRLGYARVRTIPPNDRHAELFLRLQEDAMRAGRGLWGLPLQEGVASRPRPR